MWDVCICWLGGCNFLCGVVFGRSGKRITEPSSKKFPFSLNYAVKCWSHWAAYECMDSTTKHTLWDSFLTTLSQLSTNRESFTLCRQKCKECLLFYMSYFYLMCFRQLPECPWCSVWDVSRAASEWHQDSNRDAFKSDAFALVHFGASACEAGGTPERCTHAYQGCKQHLKVSVP